MSNTKLLKAKVFQWQHHHKKMLKGYSKIDKISSSKWHPWDESALTIRPFKQELLLYIIFDLQY